MMIVIIEVYEIPELLAKVTPEYTDLTVSLNKYWKKNKAYTTRKNYFI